MQRGNTPTPPLAELADAASPSSSPPPNCAICLGKFKNKSYTETCLHEFCFNCLLRWSKIKAECPLCKQPFKSIIHNIRSNDSYDKYIVEQQHVPNEDDLTDLTSAIELYSRRFRYRTTVTLRRGDDLAIQRLLLGIPPESQLPTEPYRRPVPSVYIQQPAPAHIQSRTYNIFRRTVYRQNLWVIALPDITGRYRESNPEFYRNNPAQIGRLIPWLNRELSVFLFNPGEIVFAVSRISHIIIWHSILSRRFRELLSGIINNNLALDHFVHEFFSFASSPYDMIGYDRNITYHNGNPNESNYVNEISSTDDENELYVISPERPTAPSTARNITQPSPENRQRNLNSISNPVVIETVSHSETEDSSDEVIMVGYIKPPEQRTPEIVDLLVSSDSDAILVDEHRPMQRMSDESSSITYITRPPSPHTPPNLPSTSGLVKLSVKRNLSPTISLSDSDSDYNTKLSNYSRCKYLKTKIPRMRSRESESIDHESDSSLSSSPRRSRCSTPSSHSSDWFSRTFQLKEEDESVTERNTFLQQVHASVETFNSWSSSPSIHESRKKVKKNKHKKHSKKSSHSSKKKHKHKSKSKKRHKSKDMSNERSLSKGKYCKNSKSKMKVQKD